MSAGRIFFINTFPAPDRPGMGEITLEGAKELIHRSAAGPYRYTLMGTGHRRWEPWTTAQFALQRDPAFRPLIAVNPAYQHPVQAAKQLVALARLYGERIALNVVSGAYLNELKAIGEESDFPARERRAREFADFITAALASGDGRFRFQGEFYQAKEVSLLPRISGWAPEIFLSGAAGVSDGESAGKRFVRNILPLNEMPPAPIDGLHGLRFGILARESKEEAMAAAALAFPPSREGELLLSLQLRGPETEWLKVLKRRLSLDPAAAEFYIEPIRYSWASAPYLIGSYEEVAERIRAYARLGYGFFLIDAFPGPDEFDYTEKVISLATEADAP